MDELGLFASILGHIGDGNFHESIIYNRQVKGEREKVEMCVKNMVKRALEMEGTCTGEHSIGWGKKESLLWEVGPDTLGVMVGFLCHGDVGGRCVTDTETEIDQGSARPTMDHVGSLVALGGIWFADEIRTRNPGKIFDRQTLVTA